MAHTYTYIDPSAAVDGDGTQLTPYNAWSSVTPAAGSAEDTRQIYRQRVGTTASFHATIPEASETWLADLTGLDYVTIESYADTGDTETRAIVDCFYDVTNYAWTEDTGGQGDNHWYIEITPLSNDRARVFFDRVGQHLVPDVSDLDPDTQNRIIWWDTVSSPNRVYIYSTTDPSDLGVTIELLHNNATPFDFTDANAGIVQNFICNGHGQKGFVYFKANANTVAGATVQNVTVNYALMNSSSLIFFATGVYDMSGIVLDNIVLDKKFQRGEDFGDLSLASQTPSHENGASNGIYIRGKVGTDAVVAGDGANLSNISIHGYGHSAISVAESAVGDNDLAPRGVKINNYNYSVYPANHGRGWSMGGAAQGGLYEITNVTGIGEVSGNQISSDDFIIANHTYDTSYNDLVYTHNDGSYMLGFCNCSPSGSSGDKTNITIENITFLNGLNAPLFIGLGNLALVGASDIVFKNLVFKENSTSPISPTQADRTVIAFQSIASGGLTIADTIKFDNVKMYHSAGVCNLEYPDSDVAATTANYTIGGGNDWAGLTNFTNLTEEDPELSSDYLAGDSSPCRYTAVDTVLGTSADMCGRQNNAPKGYKPHGSTRR